MKKIISLFQRNYEGDNHVRDEVVPGAEWVLAGEGVATRKWDGTSCMIRDGQLYKRFDAKRGKTPPLGFEPVQEPDPVTGHHPGWVLCKRSSPENRWHFEAWDRFDGPCLPSGTYELCGPKINGNPEKLLFHSLIRHGVDVISSSSAIDAALGLHLLDCYSSGFDVIREYLRTADIEGIVWHHADGRMVKIKTKDFGLKRGGE